VKTPVWCPECKSRRVEAHVFASSAKRTYVLNTCLRCNHKWRESAWERELRKYMRDALVNRLKNKEV
jgi:RNase P subunit RPR2